MDRLSNPIPYPGIGPIHSHLFKTGRVAYENATDEEALKAAFRLTRLEGIIPALESAHALAWLDKYKFNTDDVVVVNLSGRGDKDMETYIRYMDKIII
jgi:tryptophan synthase beta chain